MKIKTRWSILLICSIFLLSFICREPNCLADENENFKPLFPISLNHEFPSAGETFEEVKDLILDNYYSDEISEEALYWSAIQGMLSHISPPEHPELAKIWTAEEYEKVLQALEGVQVSIGVKSTFNPQEGSLTIAEVLPNSPASGVLDPLDRVLRIDTQPLKNKSLDEVNRLLKGEEGEEIRLTINRDIEIFDVIIKRRKFETQSLVISKLNEELLLVEIKGFTADISKKLGDELKRFKGEGISSLIIDLRNNSGGLFAESLKTVELFLPEKHILLRTLQRETNLQNYVSANKEPFDFKIAILVNSKTASSSEIVVSALQDHQKAVVIGTRTYGKGVFDKTFELKNSFRTRFITGAMYSPKGKSWQSNGIIPDFLVEQDDNTLALLLKMDPSERMQKDVAIITAYKLLNRQ